jgi:F-type H+-transporting ATPase subunit b
MDILSSLQSIGFDWQVALAHVVNFLLVLWLLNKFVFGPLQKKLKERRQEIQSGVEDARAAEKKLQKAKQRREEILENAQKQRQEILSEARERAASVKEQAQKQAEKKAESMLADARKQIEKKRAQMKDELREHTGDLVISAAEKLLQREVNEDDHNQLVANTITELQDA